MILNGRVDFQKEMSAYQQLVRECETFTGPLDPLKGDAVYVAIQGTAKETMSNLFNETLRNRTDAQRPVDSFAGASVSSQAVSSMQGIGGGSRAPPAPKDDWLNRAKGTFGSGPMPAQPAPQPAQPSGFDFFGAPAQPAQPMQQPVQQSMNFGMGMQQPAQQPTMNYGMPAQQPAQQQPAAMNFDFFGM